MSEFFIAGFTGCPFFAKAKCVGEALALMYPEHIRLSLNELSSKDAYKHWLANSDAADAQLARSKDHATSPLVVLRHIDGEGSLEFVGGYDNFVAFARKRQQVDSLSIPVKSKPEICIRIFVGGDKTQVGKSSVCLGLLATLISKGFSPSSIAYIKPATQCERPQLVSRFCENVGIKHEGVGPVVFYSGFTREFLKGNTESTPELLKKISIACDQLAFQPGRRILVVDGVGYPAVGSVCGISNAEVSKSARAPVMIVGPHGVGNAIDSYNLNSSYFKHNGARVLGAIFNRFSTSGFYSLSKCKESVDDYFKKHLPGETAYGYLPDIEALRPSSGTGALSQPAPLSDTSKEVAACLRVEKVRPLNESEMQTVQELQKAFEEHVNVDKLLIDATEVTSDLLTSDNAYKGKMGPRAVSDMPHQDEDRAFKSRQEIERDAAAQGAVAKCGRV